VADACDIAAERLYLRGHLHHSGSIGADILSASRIGCRSISAHRINARNWRRSSSGTCTD
jgi:hypothetical protein